MAIAGTTLGTIAMFAVAFECPRAAAVFGAWPVGWSHTTLTSGGTSGSQSENEPLLQHRTLFWLALAGRLQKSSLKDVRRRRTYGCTMRSEPNVAAIG